MPTRVLAPIAVLALAALALAGCSGGATPHGTSSPAANGCAPAPEGPVADSIKVSGSAKSEPTVGFTSPLKVSGTQRRVITQGTGAATKPGDVLKLEFAVYDGTTGKSTTGTGYKGETALVQADVAKSLPGLVKTIECARVGSRIVGVIPPKDAFGSKGLPQLGIGPKDVMTFVVDVRGVMPDKATGASQPVPAGFPTVKLASNGKPTVTIPSDAKGPEQTMIGLLKQGTGATVASGDAVYVQYQGTNLRTGKVFDQSWGKEPQELSTTGVIAGFAKALVGQKVGSQVIVMIPPADGYQDKGSPDVGIEPTDTLIFVIDILAIGSAAQ